MSKKQVLRLATATLIFMSLSGWAVVYFFQEETLMEMLLGSSPWYYQIGLGLIYGTLTALAGWQFARLPSWEK